MLQSAKSVDNFAHNLMLKTNVSHNFTQSFIMAIRTSFTCRMLSVCHR